MPPLVVLGCGINVANVAPVALTGTMLFANGVAIPAAVTEGKGQSGKVAVENVPPVNAGQRSEKSPLRSADEGTSWSCTVEGFFSRRHSWDQKKKVFCFDGLYRCGI